MSRPELRQIIERGLTELEMEVESETVIDEITLLSQGFPHYTHLLAQQAALAAVAEGAETITGEDVQLAVERAIQKAQQSIRDAYHSATMSTRPRTLYPQVLLACALAQGDEFGFFAAADVREPLSKIEGKPYDIPAFARHLKELSDYRRGPVLQKKGETRRLKYRFVNPLMQPHIIMRGLSQGLIDRSMIGDAAT